MNYRYLSSEMHRGKYGPHKFRETDLIFKEQLERELRNVLDKDYYFEGELIRILGLDARQADKAFRHIQVTSEGMCKEKAIYRLLGNRYYL